VAGSTAKKNRAEYQKAYYAAHKDEIKAYYAAHKDEIKARNAERKEERAAYDRKYNAAHREERKEYNKAYNASHRDEINAYKRARYASNIEASRASARKQSKKRYDENKEEIGAYFKARNDATCGGHNHRQLWTNDDINKVLAKEKPDKELAKELGRTIKAIATCRWLYRTRPGLSEKELAKRNTTPIKEYEEHAVNQLE